MNTTEEQPQFMLDAQGNQIRISNIKPIDLARDALVRELILKAKFASSIIKDFRSGAFADIAAFQELSAEEYGVTVGGKKGNITLYSFDGRYKIQRAHAEHITFDERLQAAKALIYEGLNEWIQGANKNLQVIVDNVFEVDSNGNLSTGRVLSLRRYKIEDKRWVLAMNIIADSIQVIGSKAYVRVYERVGDSDEYAPISLDVASV
ncbi:hypothetical protein DTO96_102167 [Ephemeroptericola cinctiostellae]|uniref:Sulfate transporter n=1 Tax=Ephemeroptericola cinctiostellae TaxID=2268024 RepID=A0A345DDH5_9BURK|nr:DUF3164 family protein [Ephemeroptericola cinctiostellae]AXF86413.1 hypothetical protein DTO96_102167 [Ephemeroptericola cinctiostellae]